MSLSPCPPPAQSEPRHPRPARREGIPADGGPADRLRADFEAIVAEATAEIDRRNATRRWAGIGGRLLSHLRWAKASAPDWTAEDFNRIVRELAARIKATSAAGSAEVRPVVWIKVHLFVESVRPMVPAVDDLAYHQIANKFLPCVCFSRAGLDGANPSARKRPDGLFAPDGTSALKPGWAEKVRELVARQVGPDPLKMADLTAAISAHKTDLARSRLAGLAPEERRRAEEDSRRKVGRRAREKARESLRRGLAAARRAGLDPAEIASAVAELGLTPPTRRPDPAPAIVIAVGDGPAPERPWSPRKGRPEPGTGNPCTTEMVYDAEETEFLMAVQEFKTRHARPFPTLRDTLHVLKGLGYLKPAPATAGD